MNTNSNRTLDRTDPRRHRPASAARQVTHTGTALLGTSLLMPRPTRHNRALTECLMRMPIRIT